MKNLLLVSLALVFTVLAVGCYIVHTPPPEQAPAATAQPAATPAATPVASSAEPAKPPVPRIFGGSSQPADAGATD
jgi:hypothetical protein